MEIREVTLSLDFARALQQQGGLGYELCCVCASGSDGLLLDENPGTVFVFSQLPHVLD